MREPEQDECGGGTRFAMYDYAVAAKTGVRPGQKERAADCARADRGEQCSIECRSALQLAARHERQQRPVSAGEEEESNRAHERRAQLVVVARVAHARAYGTCQALAGQRA